MTKSFLLRNKIIPLIPFLKNTASGTRVSNRLSWHFRGDVETKGNPSSRVWYGAIHTHHRLLFRRAIICYMPSTTEQTFRTCSAFAKSGVMPIFSSEPTMCRYPIIIVAEGCVGGNKDKRHEKSFRKRAPHDQRKQKHAVGKRGGHMSMIDFRHVKQQVSTACRRSDNEEMRARTQEPTTKSTPRQTPAARPNKSGPSRVDCCVSTQPQRAYVMETHVCPFE